MLTFLRTAIDLMEICFYNSKSIIFQFINSQTGLYFTYFYTSNPFSDGKISIKGNFFSTPFHVYKPCLLYNTCDIIVQCIYSLSLFSIVFHLKRTSICMYNAQCTSYVTSFQLEVDQVLFEYHIFSSRIFKL